MCTIIVAFGVWPEAPLVIAANRDEALDRPASDPQAWPAGEVAERSVLAPRDLKAGGTWLGLNDRELFVGITNRRTLGEGRAFASERKAGGVRARRGRKADAREDGSRRSRGELVFRALGAADHEHARRRIRELDARDYNPFHLLLADRDGAVVVWGDGRELHEQVFGPGVHWVTERSFGAADSERHVLLERVGAELAAGPRPDAERWRSILADHGPRYAADEQPGRLAVGFDAMCVHARPLNYGTRCSTLVELGREPGAGRFLHAPGRPCATAFVDHGAALGRVLGARAMDEG
jgi:uncharacterized protein with NRDE domain